MRLLHTVLAVIFAVVAISFAVSNRAVVPMSLWPLPFEWPMPVAMVGFVGVIIGFVLGGIAAWIGAGSSRRRARQAEYKNRNQEREITRLEARTREAEDAKAAALGSQENAALPKAE